MQSREQCELAAWRERCFRLIQQIQPSAMKRVLDERKEGLAV